MERTITPGQQRPAHVWGQRKCTMAATCLLSSHLNKTGPCIVIDIRKLAALDLALSGASDHSPEQQLKQLRERSDDLPWGIVVVATTSSFFNSGWMQSTRWQLCAPDNLTKRIASLTIPGPIKLQFSSVTWSWLLFGTQYRAGG